jgi:hypothetical protein
VLFTFRLRQRLSGAPGNLGVPTEHRKALFFSGMLRSVDDWLLAMILITDVWGQAAAGSR